MTEADVSAITRYRSVAERLRGHAETMPDKVALHSIDQGSEITWGGLFGACNQVAAALAERGIGANDRVVVLTDNSLENLILYYGVQRHGATFCTVNVAHLLDCGLGDAGMTWSSAVRNATMTNAMRQQRCGECV